MGQGKVAVAMGSYSDLNRLDPLFAVFQEFGVEFEARVLSAHRTPEETAAWASSLEARGFGAVVAAAGGSAALAGAAASHTILPVIGLPIPTDCMGGLDSLLSTVQMPAGIPVATVAVGGGGAENAGLLAVQILARSDASLAEMLRARRRRQAAKVLERDAALQLRLGGELPGIPPEGR